MVDHTPASDRAFLTCPSTGSRGQTGIESLIAIESSQLRYWLGCITNIAGNHRRLELWERISPSHVILAGHNRAIRVYFAVKSRSDSRNVRAAQGPSDQIDGASARVDAMSRTSQLAVSL